MADIFYDADGAFSSAVPLNVVASFYDPTTTSTGDAVNSATTRYIAFTPSAAQDCQGAFIGFRLTSVSDSVNVTVTLQKNDGGWGDTASTKSLNLQQMSGDTYAAMSSSGLAWVYFEFGTTTTMTTDASTWRFKVESDNASSYVYLIPGAGSIYLHAVVTSTAASYSANDNIFIANQVSMTIDQSVTFTDMVLGVDGELLRTSAESGTHTLTGTDLWISRSSKITIGTAANPIALANKFTWSVTNIKCKVNYQGGQAHYLNLYGVKPTNIFTHLDGDAASGQKVITTEDDMSGDWSPGDSIKVYGGDGSDHIETRTIDTISGTTVTFTANLTNNHYDGYGVVKWDKKDSCGIGVTTTMNMSVCVEFNVHGVNVSSAGASIYTASYASNADTLLQPITVDTVFFAAGANIQATFSAQGGTYLAGSYIKNYFGDSESYNTVVLTYFPPGSSITLQDIYSQGQFSMTALYSATITDVQICGGTSSTAYMPFTGTLISATFTRCKSMGGYRGFSLGGVNLTFDSCAMDNHATALYAAGNCVNFRLNDCNFGQDVANTVGIDSGYVYVSCYLDNCLGIDVSGDRLSIALPGSFVRSADTEGTSNNDIGWFIYGKTQRTGDGLVDTTVHTAGTGKFAIRFEPMSSATNLDWEFYVPTGDIQNKTMTVAVWVKINNAAYYAGTHQLPRVTINYDNGTTAYAEATGSTAWQQLFVTFNPTTTYGQITVTLSGRTDASGSNAYIYWDDMTLLYPANNALDLGGLDNWANALPVTPPYAVPLSAYAVSNAVWEELLSSHTTTGSFGLAVGFIKKVIGWLRDLL